MLLFGLCIFFMYARLYCDNGDIGDKIDFLRNRPFNSTRKVSLLQKVTHYLQPKSEPTRKGYVHKYHDF